MKIRNILSAVYRFFTQNRAAGTSTLVGKIAKENDVWVLIVDRHQMKTEMYHEVDKSKFLTLEDLVQNRQDGMKGKPILVDNYTMLRLAELAIDKMEIDGEKLKRHEEFINDLNRLIKTHLGQEGNRFTITVEAPGRRLSQNL